MEYYKNLDLQDIIYFCKLDLIWKTEEWRNVPDYKDYYQVSDLGRVKSLPRYVRGGCTGMRFSKEMILTQTKNKRGYLSNRLSFKDSKKTKTTHQLVAVVFLNHTRCGMKKVVNHKNFIITDNRKLNLEIVTQRENGNRKHLKSSSKYVGVGWHKASNKWRARIVINGKAKYLGTFYDEIDAHNAYQNELKNL